MGSQQDTVTGTGRQRSSKQDRLLIEVETRYIASGKNQLAGNFVSHCGDLGFEEFFYVGAGWRDLYSVSYWYNGGGGKCVAVAYRPKYGATIALVAYFTLAYDMVTINHL